MTHSDIEIINITDNRRNVIVKARIIEGEERIINGRKRFVKLRNIPDPAMIIIKFERSPVSLDEIEKEVTELCKGISKLKRVIRGKSR